MATIKEIRAREILDSRGNPTVEAEVFLSDGSFGVASVPSGASTGKYEALELRDGEKRYGGKGVVRAVENIEKIIKPTLLGMEATNQREIDEKMLAEDGTKNKSKLGANAILAVSMAVCKAGAKSSGLNLYEYVGHLSQNKQFKIPTPMVLVMEGGKHADQSSDIQEYMIVPEISASFKEKIRMASEIYQILGKNLRLAGQNTNVGFEGAYGPKLGSNEKPFEMIVKAIKDSGHVPKVDVGIAIDVAGSELYKDGKYDFRAERKTLTSDEVINLYENLISKYPISSIEDGLGEDDWQSWMKMTAKIGSKTKIVGDDLTVTNILKLQEAVNKKAINTILIKLNQIGTVTETIDVVNFAKKNSVKTIVSHRSAETEDTFSADFAVGVGADYVKFGATARSERVAKYNQLLRIEGNIK